LEQIYVDRVDTKHIRSCPHDLPVTGVEILGVQVFQHPDGEPCSVLNNLQMSGSEVNEADPRLRAAKADAQSIFEKLDEAEIYSRLSTDTGLIQRVAKELDASRSKKKVEEWFLKIARGKNAVEVFKAIGTALGPKKRRIVLENIACVYVKHRFKEDLRHLVPLLVEYYEKYVQKEKANAPTDH
jgi:hypothetical protein